MSDSRILFVSDTKTDARVAQLVEHDLAKVGVAGSSPVSRSYYVKRTSEGCPFFYNRAMPWPEGSSVSVPCSYWNNAISEIWRQNF